MRPEDQLECCLPPSSILGRGRKDPGRMPRISVALIRRDLSRSSRLCLQCWGESMCRSRVRILISALRIDRVAVIVLRCRSSSDTFYVETDLRPANERARSIVQVS